MDRMFLVTHPNVETTPTKPFVLYEDDPYAWALQQVELLRSGRVAELDLHNIADEIEDVATRQYEQLESDLSRVIQHLLKWDFQPERRSRSWVSSILEHRRRVERRLQRHPSLKGRRSEALAEAFERGRAEALIETGLPDAAFPSANAQSWDEIMSRPIEWPDDR